MSLDILSFSKLSLTDFNILCIITITSILPNTVNDSISSPPNKPSTFLNSV